MALAPAGRSHRGEQVRLQFLRKEHNACTKEVVFPTLGIRRELPPDEPVYIDLPVLEVGETGPVTAIPVAPAGVR